MAREGDMHVAELTVLDWILAPITLVLKGYS